MLSPTAVLLLIALTGPGATATRAAARPRGAGRRGGPQGFITGKLVFISMKLNYNLYVNFDWCRKVPRGAKLAKLDKALLTKGLHRQITALSVCPDALFHASPAVGRRFAC